MNFCINPKSQQVIDLAEELGLPTNVTAAKAGHWMSENNSDELPTIAQLSEFYNINQSLFGLDNDKDLEFHVNTINVVSQFLDNIGVEQTLVKEFLTDNGTIVDNALAASNFVNATVEIIDDLEKRPAAWNKLPEEAAHWWYRLLDKNSDLKDALLQACATSEKEAELRNNEYGEAYVGPRVVARLDMSRPGKYLLTPMREEAIGQLIAESIKRIEEKNGSAEDYSFFKKFLDWLNTMVNMFKNIFKDQDPFEVAAMKILSSDMTDLLSVEEYQKLNNIVNFANIPSLDSTKPLSYTLIEDIGLKGRSQRGFHSNGFIYKPMSTLEENDFIDNGPGYSYLKIDKTGDINYVTQEEAGKAFNESVTESPYYFIFNGSFVEKYGYISPIFKTEDELDRWVGFTVTEHNNRQEKIARELVETEDFFNDLYNNKFIKRSKFLNKTIRKLYTIENGQNRPALPELTLKNLETSPTISLTKQQKESLEYSNQYTNIIPTLKVLPELLSKFKKRPISLNEKFNMGSAKKQENATIQHIIDLIKEENPTKKSISAEDLANEVHNYLKLNYTLGFGNEQTHLTYRIDQIFTHVPDRVVSYNDDINLEDMTDEQFLALPIQDRMRMREVLGLTKKNPAVYHNKISLRFNDTYSKKSGHFPLSPSAWSNLTAFYSGNTRFKNAVLLHEIQNDNIEYLRAFDTKNLSAEGMLNSYLKQLDDEFNKNINVISNSGKSINNNILIDNIPSSTYDNSNVPSAFRNPSVIYIGMNLDKPDRVAYQIFKDDLRERLDLHRSSWTYGTVDKTFKSMRDNYSKKRKLQDLQRRGGLISLATKEELDDLKNIIDNVNLAQNVQSAVFLEDENQWEPGGDPIPYRIHERKDLFKRRVDSLNNTLNKRAQDIYGKGFPYIKLAPAAKALPKSRRNTHTRVINHRLVTIGNSTNLINNSVKYLFYNTEKSMLNELDKSNHDLKKTYNSQLGQESKFNLQEKIYKISLDQYVKLRDRYRGNLELLREQYQALATRDLENAKNNTYEDDFLKSTINPVRRDTLNPKSEIIGYSSNVVAGYTIKGETVDVVLERVKIQLKKIDTSDVQSLLEKEYITYTGLRDKAMTDIASSSFDLIDSVEKTLETEKNYFNPLIHYTIQKHIKTYGREIPLYFSGFHITKLSQGNVVTSALYAGKDEVILSKPLHQLKVETSDYLRLNKAEDSDEKKIESLINYGKSSVGNSQTVTRTLITLNNDNPIQPGIMYTLMTQVSGVKLKYVQSILGINHAGGYLVDLTDYTLDVPVLYGLQSNLIKSNKSSSIISVENRPSIDVKEKDRCN